MSDENKGTASAQDIGTQPARNVDYVMPTRIQQRISRTGSPSEQSKAQILFPITESDDVRIARAKSIIQKAGLGRRMTAAEMATAAGQLIEAEPHLSELVTNGAPRLAAEEASTLLRQAGA